MTHSSVLLAPASWSPRTRGALAALLLAAVLGASAGLNSAGQSPFFCVVHTLTTVPCPSCGMTRAFVAMGHGRWGEAFAAHAAGPMLYLAALAGLALALAQVWMGRPLGGAVWSRLRRVAVPLVLGGIAIGWVLNLLERMGG